MTTQISLQELTNRLSQTRKKQSEMLFVRGTILQFPVILQAAKNAPGDSVVLISPQPPS